MKREQARLEELRSMSFADYALTPEWQMTQKAALKRAENRCQICNASNVSLTVHHKTYDNLGCEQEQDLLVLCETCYDLIQNNARAVVPQSRSESKSEEDVENPPSSGFSFGKRAAVFAPTALVTMGLPALLHAPLPAEVVGLVGAVILAANSPRFYKEIKGSLPVPVTNMVDGAVERQQIRAATREWSTLDRLLGRHLNATLVDDQVNEDEQRDEMYEDMQEPDEIVLEPVFPPYEDRVTLRLGKTVDKDAQKMLSDAFEVSKEKYQKLHVSGRRFDPHFNALLGKGWVAAANQGFGKSILNGVIIERAGECGLPVIVLDHKGEYRTVKELDCMNALLVGGTGNVDFVLTPETADEFVQLVFRNRYQAIVNLPSYGTGWLCKAQIAAAVGQALMRYAEKQRRLEKKLLPCLIIMDEAQLYLPQDQSLLPPEAQANKDVLSELKNAYFALVSNGRSAGYTVGFATQSLTYLAKWAIKSSQVRIFGRHSEKNDLDACEQIINPLVATRDQIEAFPPGVAVVFGFTTQPVVVQFDQKRSRDLSQTPAMEWLHEKSSAGQPEASIAYVQRIPARYYRDEQHEESRAVVPASAASTGNRPSYIHEVSRQSEEVSRTGHFAAGLPPRIRVAYDAYVPGMTWRDLGAALGYNDSDARAIWQELRRRHLLRNGSETPEPDNAAREVVAPPQAVQKSELEQALEAWDAGHTTIDALAVALGKTPWTVRPLYQRVKQIRQKVG